MARCAIFRVIARSILSCSGFMPKFLASSFISALPSKPSGKGNFACKIFESILRLACPIFFNSAGGWLPPLNCVNASVFFNPLFLIFAPTYFFLPHCFLHLFALLLLQFPFSAHLVGVIEIGFFHFVNKNG